MRYEFQLTLVGYIVTILFISSCTSEGVQDENVSDTTVIRIRDTQQVGKIDYNPAIPFEEYAVSDLYDNEKAPLKLEEDTFFWLFRRTIREAYQNDTVNFAGHYIFTSWDCGSKCEASAVIDIVTGIPYKGVDASGEYQYRQDSRMLVVNPPTEKIPGANDTNCLRCDTQLYVWDEKGKQFESLEQEEE